MLVALTTVRLQLGELHLFEVLHEHRRKRRDQARRLG
jgi:hypothetical protein